MTVQSAAGSPVLVLLDHADAAAGGALRPPVLELLTAGRDLGPVHGVWVGASADVAAVSDQLAAYGVEAVHVIDVGDADVRSSAVVGEALAQAATALGASALLLTSSFENKEVAALVGVRTGAGLVVDATSVERDGGRVVAGKTVLAGTWTTRCAVRTPLAVVALKANALAPEPASAPGAAAVHALAVTVPDSAVRVEEHTSRPPSERPALGEAQSVVAGGRGTEGDFSVVEELADALGAAVGATRVATDEGWIGHEAQIGQTGITIAPRLYVGLGISGAVHHRGGMQASGTIVAVNSDPEAPIFEIADFGVVGDLFAVARQAAAEIRRLQG